MVCVSDVVCVLPVVVPGVWLDDATPILGGIELDNSVTKGTVTVCTCKSGPWLAHGSDEIDGK